MLTASAIFNPTPDRASRLLADLDDTSLSFDDLAKKHGTSTEALSFWLSTDSIQDRIKITLDAMALRVRSVAISRLPAALDAVVPIIQDYRLKRATEPTDPSAPDYLLCLESLRRRDETVRRAGGLLLRLCNFFSPQKPPPSPRSPGRGVEAPLARASAGEGDRGSARSGEGASRDREGRSSNERSSTPVTSAIAPPPSPRSPGRGPEALRGGEGRSPNEDSATSGRATALVIPHAPPTLRLADTTERAPYPLQPPPTYYINPTPSVPIPFNPFGNSDSNSPILSLLKRAGKPAPQSQRPAHQLAITGDRPP